MFKKVSNYLKNRKEKKLLKQYNESFLKDLMNFEEYKNVIKKDSN